MRKQIRRSTAQLISAFVFATYIYVLNPKCEASGCTDRFGRKLRRQVFSRRRGSNVFRNTVTNVMSRVMRKPAFWFPTWSETNQAAQLQKRVRGLKFHIKQVEGLHYLCSENKGADQLRGYREVDLRLCFRIYAKRWISHDSAHLEIR